jgi:hypothetical protein
MYSSEAQQKAVERVCEVRVWRFYLDLQQACCESGLAGLHCLSWRIWLRMRRFIGFW